MAQPAHLTAICSSAQETGFVGSSLYSLLRGFPSHFDYMTFSQTLEMNPQVISYSWSPWEP